MSRKNPILFVIAMACFVAGTWTGCTVGFSPEQDGVFPCESNDDCIQGYECAETEMVCQKITTGPVEAPPCVQDGNPEGDIDLDNDGYGTGTDRTECPQPEEDCNDDNPDVHPNAAELCDGADNNCDGGGPDGANKIDEFTCETSSDCGAPPADYAGYLGYDCMDGSCVMIPFNRPADSVCEQIEVTCNSAEKAFTYTVDGQTYSPEDVPSECR